MQFCFTPWSGQRVLLRSSWAFVIFYRVTQAPPFLLLCISPAATRTISLNYHANREKGSDWFSKWNVSLAIARNLENRSHECAEFALLSDDAIRSGPACGDSRLELYDPDAGVVKS